MTREDRLLVAGVWVLLVGVVVVEAAAMLVLALHIVRELAG